MISLGRRPTIPEIRAYYARPDIVHELLQGMKRWHVRYVPGSEQQSWVYTESTAELQDMLTLVLDRMEGNSEIVDYPYFRINYARYRPAHSWDEDALWGHDFVIEKDSALWQECFEAMLPVMDLLEYFGVHYWLKYSGHHSLHLIIPAEVFPKNFHGVLLNDCYTALYHRLMVFLNRRANQIYNEHNRHCPPGTNMPYSVNEDTGLVNLPLKREDIDGFRPWHASIHLVEPCDFWRTVPSEAWGSGAALLEEVMKPTIEQKHYYVNTTNLLQLNQVKAREYATNERISHCCLTKQQAIVQLNSTITEERLHAAWTLMVQAQPETTNYMVIALADENADVRWFAAQALARCGTIDALEEFLTIPPDDMAGACLVDYCVRHGAGTIPALIDALSNRYASPYNTLPFDKALERIGEASRPYLEVLQQQSHTVVRRIASDILHRLAGTPSAEEVLAMSMQHNTKNRAATMLGWYDDPRIYSRVTELCADMSNDRVRRECIKALLWNDHPDADFLLQRALSDPNKKVRHWAEEYLNLLKQLSPLTEQETH